MIKRVFLYLRNEDGIAFLYVLIAFLVLVLLSTSVAFVFGANHKQALNQEEKMKSHYLLLGGIDITKSTLLSTVEVEDDVEVNMIEKIINDGLSQLNDSIEIDGQTVNIDVEYSDTDNEIIITSNLDGTSYSLSLVMDVSGSVYTERWEP